VATGATQVQGSGIGEPGDPRLLRVVDLDYHGEGIGPAQNLIRQTRTSPGEQVRDVPVRRGVSQILQFVADETATAQLSPS
jgi:hypothetical protein